MGWAHVSKLVIHVFTGLLTFFGIILYFIATTILIQSEKFGPLRNMVAIHGIPPFLIGIIMILTGTMITYAVLSRKILVLDVLNVFLMNLFIALFYITVRTFTFDSSKLFINIIEKLKSNLQPLTSEMQDLQEHIQCCGIFGPLDYKTLPKSCCPPEENCVKSSYIGCVKKAGNEVLEHLLLLEVTYTLACAVTIATVILLKVMSKNMRTSLKLG